MRDYLDHAMHDAGRIELRHQLGDRWTSGLFDDVGALRREIANRAGGGNLYTTINAPRDLPVSNAMGARALGDDDIATHTRLVFDFDPVRPKDTPSTGAEMMAATRARDALVSALQGTGWPAPARAMSGNGAHAVFRWRAPVTAESREMLSVLYRGLRADFSTESVGFDSTVRNPARIWRLYGTQNRKGTQTPDRPHRVALVAIPSRWAAVSPQQVERLASSYARRPAPTQVRVAPHVRGSGDYTSLDIVGWFKARGLYRRHLEGDMHAVRCPWESEHSTEDGENSTATVAWEATGRCWPNFRCLHAHCDDRRIADVMELLGDAISYCARAWRVAP